MHLTWIELLPTWHECALASRFCPPTGNIIVRHVAIDLSDKKEWELSGIIEAPVEVAYNCPGWVWATLMKVLLEAALTRKIGILMHPCSTTIVARLRKRLLRRLRGFMEVVRQVRRTPLKRLWNLARNGIHSNEDTKLGEQLLARWMITTFETCPPYRRPLIQNCHNPCFN